MHIQEKKTILAIGGTGTGKSTFGQTIFGLDTIPGGGYGSVTKQAALFENDQYRYIDTPGFSDSDGKDDTEIFRNMLSLIQNHSEDNKFKVDFILWFCLESERCDQTLQRGANFIQKLVEYADLKNFDGNIWKSVLIIIKGPMLSPNLSEGPKVAAKLAMMKFINDKNLDVDNCVVKVDHLACWIFDLNNSFGAEISFIQAKCKRCNCLGDPRLFDKFCHPGINPSPKHNIQIQRYHPKNLIRDHSDPAVLVHSDRPKPPTRSVLPTMISGAITGAAAAARPAAVAAGPAGLAAGTIAGGILGAAAGVILSSNEKCRDCQRSFSEKGCVKQCSNCNRFWGESGCRWKYTCCGWDETRPGCETMTICKTPECDVRIGPCVCGACGMLLGTEGCTKDIEHDIHDINDNDDNDTESL